MVNMEIRIITFLIGATVLRGDGGFGLLLEADCNKPQPPTVAMPAPSVLEFPFRTDRVTREECRKFKYLIPCSPVRRQLSCNHVKTDDTILFDPRSKTYLEIDCSERDRLGMEELVRNVSGESPTRAITLTLLERNDANDPIHAHVFEPIRNQIIEFTAKCASSVTTSKVYDVGVLHSLFKLEMKSCRNLTIRKQDFTRLPRVLMISFETSTIETIERGTFSNLPTLQSLQLESGIAWQIREIKQSVEDNRDGDSAFKEWDVEKIRRLHCDCSFVWLRNFIKEKPELFGRKSQGEAFVVGNYLSPFVHDTFLHGDMQLLSVDCSHSLTESNMNAGSDFSYNTTCYSC